MKAIRGDIEHQLELREAVACCNGNAIAHVFAATDRVAMLDVVEAPCI